MRAINGAYTTIQTTNKNIPFSERPGWGKDYADPYTFFGELFDSRAMIPSGNTNYSLVGITPEINTSKKLGVTGNLDNVPSVNADIDNCIAQVRRRPHDVLGEPRQEGDDATSYRGSRTCGRTTSPSSARRSRTGTTTSSPTAPPTRRCRSSSNEALDRVGRHGAPP